jgi:hypothetical protein
MSELLGDGACESQQDFGRESACRMRAFSWRLARLVVGRAGKDPRLQGFIDELGRNGSRYQWLSRLRIERHGLALARVQRTDQLVDQEARSGIAGADSECAGSSFSTGADELAVGRSFAQVELD